MNSPSQLPLFGFANPREQRPAFLVPIFGTDSDLWIQDGKGTDDDLVSQFCPCTLPPETIMAERGQRQFSARIGEALIYAFQFSNGHIEIGSRSSIRKKLTERLNEFQSFPFLIIDILKFIEKPNPFPV